MVAHKVVHQFGLIRHRAIPLDNGTLLALADERLCGGNKLQQYGATRYYTIGRRDERRSAAIWIRQRFGVLVVLALQREPGRGEDSSHEAIRVVAHKMPLMNRQELIYNHIGHELADIFLVEYDRVLCLLGVWG